MRAAHSLSIPSRLGERENGNLDPFIFVYIGNAAQESNIFIVAQIPHAMGLHARNKNKVVRPRIFSSSLSSVLGWWEAMAIRPLRIYMV